MRQLHVEYQFGSLYLKITERAVPLALSVIVKNLWTLLKTVPFAGRNAERHLATSVAIAREIGAKGIHGRACYDLGTLYQLLKREEEAKQYFNAALDSFRECEAERYMMLTKRALDALTDNRR